MIRKVQMKEEVKNTYAFGEALGLDQCQDCRVASDLTSGNTGTAADADVLVGGDESGSSLGRVAGSGSRVDGCESLVTLLEVACGAGLVTGSFCQANGDNVLWDGKLAMDSCGVLIGSILKLCSGSSSKYLHRRLYRQSDSP